MLIKIVDVFDCTPRDGAVFYKVGIETRNSEAMILKYVKDEVAGKWNAESIMRRPVAELTVVMDQYDRHVYLLGRGSRIVKDRVITSAKQNG